MNIDFLSVYGFSYAIKGMRKSFNSEEKSDTNFLVDDNLNPDIGEKDLSLLLKLVKSGDAHAKCMRFVIAYLEINAPRYWWQQFDTYKIGVEQLSQSTMHTMMEMPLEISDFEIDKHDEEMKDLIKILNFYIRHKMFKKVKIFLPESFLQTRMICCNYQSLRHIYLQRKNHRLEEWHYFCDWIDNNMPHSEFITEE